VQPVSLASPANPSITNLPAITGFNGPQAITITPSGDYAYVTNQAGNSVTVIDTNPASPTFNTVISAPSLASGFNLPTGLAIAPNGQYGYIANAAFAANNVVIFSALEINQPQNFTGCIQRIASLGNVSMYNRITWKAPVSGGDTPVSYNIYRDAALTQLVASVPANVFSYNDSVSNGTSTYYIVAIDAQNNASLTASTTVTSHCFNSCTGC
jgi:DNA-binding beta-propeller fold protein YncE